LPFHSPSTTFCNVFRGLSPDPSLFLSDYWDDGDDGRPRQGNISDTDEEHLNLAVASNNNPVHQELINDGYELAPVCIQTNTSKVCRENFFTRWAKLDPSDLTKPLRFAVCECEPGKCKM